MIVALDVGYSDRGSSTDGRCGVVAFSHWGSNDVVSQCTAVVADVAPYVPGRLVEREMPCLLEGIQMLAEQFALEPSVLLVDGNVRLDQAGRSGLGQHLFDYLQGRIPVVGIAKTPFTGLAAVEVRRGISSRPLFVTAAGMDEADAAVAVKSMAGAHRIPAMLALADALSRGRRSQSLR